MSSDTEHADVDRDAEESAAMSKALRWGIGLGTPVTIAVFFTILMLAGIGFHRSLIAASWTGIVGGAFYGGITALFHIMNKYD